MEFKTKSSESLHPDEEIPTGEIVVPSNESVRRKMCHPFKCRLDEMASIETSSSSNMTQVGFACWGIGMLTIFRPSFVLIVSIISRVKVSSSETDLPYKCALVACCFWFALVAFVFFILGFIPLFATVIKKRWVLLIHPWAFMLLYFDAVVWLTIAVILHVQLTAINFASEHVFSGVSFLTLYFVIIYVDVVVYFIIHYVYATYYIVAELTIIEKFY